MTLAFTDMQGRLAGKRLSAEYFLDEVAEHFAEGCNYLLAVDVDMNTVDGYEMSSWDRGYGDFVMKPDPATLRRVPWLPATALLLADLTWLDGTPVIASPRQILRAQTDRLAERGLVAMAGTATSSSSSTATATSNRPTRATRTWCPPISTTSTTRYSARRGSTRCCAGSPAA